MDLTSYNTKLEVLKADLKGFDANLADSDHHELQKMFEVVFNASVLDITDLDKKTQDIYKLELFSMLSNISGTLSFLVIQILAAHNIMKKNSFPQTQYINDKKCGIAINHLRVNKTVVSAVKVANGYLLKGTLKWASGYKIFDTLLIGFHCQGLEMEALADFSSQDGFEIGSADETFVGYGLYTVDIKLKDFFVPNEVIVSSNPIGNYTKNKSASKTVHFCLYGLGVYAINNTQDKEFTAKATKELKTVKDAFMHTTDIEKLDNLRIELFVLVEKIVTTAMILEGGSCVLCSKPLQRVYRELMMFNANGLNETLKQKFKKDFLGYGKLS